jgi:hypothetical protein
MKKTFAIFVRVHVAALGLMIAGCGEGQETSSGGTTTPTFDYPMDDVLRLNQIQAKGTHNSYHIAPEDMTFPALLYTHAPLDVQLSEQGVRQMELDVRYDKFKNHFLVFHETFDKGTTCGTLIDCLGLVKGWSDKFPAHHPIFIQIETKDGTTESEAEAYFKAMDEDVLSVFPRDRIVTPDDVRGSAASVREAVTGEGWPLMGQVRGKVVFFIDDSSDLRAFYTHGKKDLDGRLMFIDADSPEDPWAGVLLANDPVGDAARIEESVSAGLIVRTRADSDNVEPLAGDTSKRDKAFESGAQLVSTDYPAAVKGVDYVVEVPGGTPSRCNPKNAPKGCTSEAVEDPKLVKE